MSTRGLRYMPALDGLRGLAVIAVLLYHGEVGWAQGGYFGVDAFFVLSGFLITGLLLGEADATGRIDLKGFWTRRARRLLPALGLVLAAVTVYAAHAATAVELSQLRRDGISTILYVANWNQIISHQSYFQQFAAPSALRHTWSLAIEEQFYLVWPLVVFFALRRGLSRRAMFIGCGVLAVASATLMGLLYQPGHDPSRVYYGTDTRAQSLLIGAMLAIALAGREHATPRVHRWVLHGGGIAAALGLAFIWTTTSENDGWQYRGGFALAAVLVAIVIASVTRPGDHGPLGALLSNRRLRAIGMISYGLYLWHWPIYVYLSPDRTGLPHMQLLVVRIVVTFAIAGISYFCVERPIRHGVLPRRVVQLAAPAFAAGLGVALVASTAGAVPPEFQSISASQVAPPPAPLPAPSAASAPNPMRVMLVGDSVAASMAPGLRDEAKADGFLFWSVAVPGCGLSSDVGEHWNGVAWRPHDTICDPPWRTRWRTQLAQFHPDVVVVLVGAQDTFDRRIAGRVIKFDTDAGAQLAEQDLHDAVSTLSSAGAHVVLLTTPYYVLGWPMQIDVNRSCMSKPWIDRYNSFQRAIAQEYKQRASILDLNRYIDPGGVWTDTVNGIKVRTFDKMHLSDKGAEFVGKWLAPQLPTFTHRLPGTQLRARAP